MKILCSFKVFPFNGSNVILLSDLPTFIYLLRVGRTASGARTTSPGFKVSKVRHALMLCMTVCLHAGTGRCGPSHRVLRYTPVTGFPPFLPWGRVPPGGLLLLERCRAGAPVHIHICIFAHRRFSHASNSASANSTWTRLCVLM